MAVAIGATHGWYDGSPATGMGLIAPVSAGIAAAIAFALVLGERRGAVLIAIVTGWALGLVLGDLTTNPIGMPWLESSAGLGPLLSEPTAVASSMEHLVSGVITGVVFGPIVAVVGIPGTARGPRREGATVLA